MDKRILVTRPHLPDRRTFDRYLDRIWENRWLTNDGQILGEFTQAIQDRTKADRVTLFTNGHLALEAALQALGLTGEVITTPYTFASTAHAIVRCGLKPVFCDIKPDDMTIDPQKIEPLITKDTAAILPVHVYGHCCDVIALEQIAHAHGLKLIYDAAHAFDETLANEHLVNFGDVSMVSFHATKIMNTIEGGALFYHDQSLQRRFELLRNFGIRGETVIECVGGNAKMNEFQAAMGLCNLQDFDGSVERRKVITAHYRARLEGKDGVHLFYPDHLKDFTYNYSYMPILIDEKAFGASRDAVYEALMGKQIYSRRYFYPLLTNTQAYKGISACVPVAQWTSEHILCLPDYDDLSEEDIDRVCDELLGCQRR